MNITLHENGWTIIVNEDIRMLSDQEIREVGRLALTNLLVVFKKQSLTIDDEERICNLIGECQYYPEDYEPIKSIRHSKHILRVTGKLDKDGDPGLFGHEAALDWHADQPSNEDRYPLIWLYGAEGTTGSRTSYINNVASYEALSDVMKEKIADIKVFCGYESGRYSPSTFFKEHINTNNAMNLVYTNNEGKVGLFFPFLQIFGFDGYEQEEFGVIMQELTDHVLQEQFVYHHDWDDGDVVLSEQWLSIHKRWEFDKMKDRVLHRIALDYSKLY